MRVADDFGSGITVKLENRIVIIAQIPSNIEITWTLINTIELPNNEPLKIKKKRQANCIITKR